MHWLHLSKMTTFQWLVQKKLHSCYKMGWYTRELAPVHQQWNCISLVQPTKGVIFYSKPLKLSSYRHINRWGENSITSLLMHLSCMCFPQNPLKLLSLMMTSLSQSTCKWCTRHHGFLATVKQIHVYQWFSARLVSPVLILQFCIKTSICNHIFMD